MIFNVSAGGSPRIPNDPAAREGPPGGSPFKTPAAWAPWGQSTPIPQPPSAAPPGVPGNGPGVPQDGLPGGGTSNHTSPLARSLLGGPGGLPANPLDYGPQTQAAVGRNQDFVDEYGRRSSVYHTGLLDTMKQMTGMLNQTNPYTGMTTSATLSGG